MNWTACRKNNRLATKTTTTAAAAGIFPVGKERDENSAIFLDTSMFIVVSSFSAFIVRLLSFNLRFCSTIDRFDRGKTKRTKDGEAAPPFSKRQFNSLERRRRRRKTLREIVSRANQRMRIDGMVFGAPSPVLQPPRNSKLECTQLF